MHYHVNALRQFGWIDSIWLDALSDIMMIDKRCYYHILNSMLLRLLAYRSTEYLSIIHICGYCVEHSSLEVFVEKLDPSAVCKSYNRREYQLVNRQICFFIILFINYFDAYTSLRNGNDMDIGHVIVLRSKEIFLPDINKLIHQISIN